MQRIVMLKGLCHELRGYKTKLLINLKVQCIDTIRSNLVPALCLSLYLNLEI